jgi:RNA polymerase sigma-70 factor (ECF subfamily)
VQDAFFGLLRRLPELDPIRREALEHYLRRSIQNRVRDEVRRAGQVEVSEVDAAPRPGDDTSPLSAAMAREDEERYRCGLLELDQADRELIVGRLDLGYSYDQLALATGRPSADAARVAVRRAMLKLAERIDAR